MTKFASAPLFVLIILISISCEKRNGVINIKGSWFSDLGTGGIFDSLVNYTELYITDSTFQHQEELFGQHRPRNYYIKDDSIFITDIHPKPIPMFKIDLLRNDTLHLSVNRSYLNKRKDLIEVWVRLPETEKGHYDHVWTEQHTDSLKHAVVNDYLRRMWRYHLVRQGRADYYDSLVEAGTWDWSMNQFRETERMEQ